MPASPTRPCRNCSQEKNTPEDFRDIGETGAGRPPTVCRACREADPDLMSAHLANIARRPDLRAMLARRRARPEAEVLAARAARYPDGVKDCPVISGCGQNLPFSEFSPNASQVDGLERMCRPCKSEYRQP